MRFSLEKDPFNTEFAAQKALLAELLLHRKLHVINNITYINNKSVSAALILDSEVGIHSCELFTIFDWKHN